MAVSEAPQDHGQGACNPFIDFIYTRIGEAFEDSSGIQLECVANQVQILESLGTISKNVADELLDIIGNPY